MPLGRKIGLAQPLLFSRLDSCLAATRALPIAAIALVVVGSSCLYTDPVNMVPDVDIIPPNQQIWRKHTATFTARVSDPNGDSVRLEWAHTTGCAGISVAAGVACDPCPTGSNDYLDPGRWPDGRADQQSYDVDAADTDGPFCVWAFATDSHGAVKPAIYAVNPSNHAPVANIGLVAPAVSPGALVPLYSEVELSAGDSSDAEQDPSTLTFTWKLLAAPPGSALVPGATSGGCSRPTSGSSWCLVPDIGGTYRAQLTVQDDWGVVSVATRDIQVADDQLPCVDISTLTPNVPVKPDVDPTTPVMFRVNFVHDDGDPFPLDPTAPHPASRALHFNWFKGLVSGPLGTGPLEYVPNDAPDFKVEAEYSSGDWVAVRVEVFDRNESAIKAKLQSCGNDDVCGETVGAMVCNQRWTWRINYR